MSMSTKQLAQPYVGNDTEMLDALSTGLTSRIQTMMATFIEARYFASATTAELADVGDAINTANKFAGKMVWDTDKGQPVWADGAAAADTWSLSTGVVASSPV